MVGKAEWEIDPRCTPSTDHPGNLEEPGLCAGNWGCPSLPPLPISQPGWCWRSSPGSRKWGRSSLSPGTRRALLLPGKQSGSRNRALSSMAILRPRAGASLGAAQRVLCQCGRPVTLLPGSDTAGGSARLLPQAETPPHVLLQHEYKDNLRVVLGKWLSPEFFTACPGDKGCCCSRLDGGFCFVTFLSPQPVVRSTHGVPLPPRLVGENCPRFWCHINLPVADSAPRCSAGPTEGMGNGFCRFSLLSLRLSEKLCLLQIHTKPELLPKPPVESSRSVLELLCVHPTTKVPFGDSCPSSGGTPL